jgi:hypothetical protein
MGDRTAMICRYEYRKVISIWDTVLVYQHGYLPYRYVHLGYRYGIWANDMGDDSIDKVISHIDMGYPVTLACRLTPDRLRLDPSGFSAWS